MQNEILAEVREQARREGALEFRQRCAKIFFSHAAKGRMAQAKILALDTPDLSAKEAIAVLEASPLDEAAAASPGMAITDAKAAELWAKAIANVQ